MSYKEKIEEYLELVTDFDLSPFESIDGLHIRDRLEEAHAQLTAEEKELLRKADLTLFLNVDPIYNHLKKAHDFTTRKPSTGWWWELNKFIGRVNVNELIELLKQQETKNRLA